MDIVEFLVAGAFGGLVGAGELVSRYKDSPARAMWSLAAAAYVLVNALASVSALALIRALGWSFGVTNAMAVGWVQTLVAGFGAMGLFRSSLFIVHAGGQDVGAGPSAFLQVALGAADRAVDRKRASARAVRVERLMDGVVFEKASVALPTYCFALMQNVGAHEQADLSRAVDELVQSSMDDRSRVLSLGLVLMNLVGDTALESAIKSLGPAIRRTDQVAGPS
jgi:hypothetical protein